MRLLSLSSRHSTAMPSTLLPTVYAGPPPVPGRHARTSPPSPAIGGTGAYLLRPARPLSSPVNVPTARATPPTIPTTGT